MCEFVFFSEWSWCQSAVQSVVLHMEALLFISFYYFKIHCKKNVILYQKKFCLIEENCFWWVLLWDCFVVDSVFFLHMVASVLAGGKVVQCLIWFEVVFFYSFDDFFSMIWWNTIMVFFPPFFLWDFLSLVSLRRGRFFPVDL